jgi:hypothetical protein
VLTEAQRRTHHDGGAGIFHVHVQRVRGWRGGGGGRGD